ncbi:MAG: phosphatidylserine decarboxylase [Thermoplasmata archaeon]
MFAPGSGRYIALAGAIVAVLFAIALLLSTWVILPFAIAAFAVGLFLAIFFRDPERTPGPGIVSAADGRVALVAQEDDHWRIAVFMNVGNVHVNRVPLTGVVRSIGDRGQGSRPAYRADAVHNRQRSYLFDTELGPVEVVQMTGIVARRLVSFVRPEEHIAKGARFGMIVLGSRVDVLLPSARARPTVQPGARVRAGVSTIAEAIG